MNSDRIVRKLNIVNGHKLFTPVFTELCKAKGRFVVNWGGTGSSKSHSAVQKELLISFEQKMKILVVRKVGTTLRDSVIPSFMTCAERLGLSGYFKYHKTDRILHNTLLGSQIIFRGLDDPEKLKSFEGLNRIMIEEASELTPEDFMELNRRARGVEDIQITLCFNPVHETHWLKERFFDMGDDDISRVHSTYKDNPFLTDKDREHIELLKLYNNNQYRIYALGEWGLSENTNPWLFAFSREQHTAPTLPFLPSYPVYLSFDFNREPVTCIAAQMSPHKAAADSFIHFIKEFSANGQLSELCTRIKAAFPASMFFVTGDASGNRGDVGFDSRHATYYQMIRSYLNLTQRQLKLNTRNLEHNDSRLLINTMLHEYPNIKISQQGCPLLINDCDIAMVDESTGKPGMLRKDRGIYKMDLFDAFRYFFQTWYQDMVYKVFLPKPGWTKNY